MTLWLFRKDHFNSNCYGYFLATCGNIWATFYFNIWLHWLAWTFFDSFAAGRLIVKVLSKIISSQQIRFIQIDHSPTMPPFTQKVLCLSHSLHVSHTFSVCLSLSLSLSFSLSFSPILAVSFGLLYYSKTTPSSEFYFHFCFCPIAFLRPPYLCQFHLSLTLSRALTLLIFD